MLSRYQIVSEVADPVFEQSISYYLLSWVFFLIVVTFMIVLFTFLIRAIQERKEEQKEEIRE